MPNLVELDLSHNFLREIPVEALSGLKNLKFLNLGSNRIQVSYANLLNKKTYLINWGDISGETLYITIERNNKGQ